MSVAPKPGMEALQSPSGDVVADLERLNAELTRLRKVEQILQHAFGELYDRTCWKDVFNAEVAALVGVPFAPKLLPKQPFLGNCTHYYDCLAAGTPYQTPPLEGKPLGEMVAGWRDQLSRDEQVEFYIALHGGD